MNANNMPTADAEAILTFIGNTKQFFVVEATYADVVCAAMDLQEEEATPGLNLPPWTVLTDSFTAADLEAVGEEVSNHYV